MRGHGDRRVRLVVAAVVAVFVALPLAIGIGPVASPASAAPPPYHPERLAHVGDAHQVVVVTSKRWGSTVARMRVYRRDAHGEWHLRFGPWRARVGYNGMERARERRQGDGTTPAGTFDLGHGFGSRPDPGTRLADYRRFDGNDYWVYDPRDPRTYNVLEPRRSSHAEWRRSWAERLADWGDREYTFGVVVEFNLPSRVRWSDRLEQYVARDPADTRRGGGIFLHVNGSGATAGCVSVSKPRMRRLLRFLDSDKAPKVVLGPRRAITRM